MLKLRDYQQEMIDKVIQSLRAGHRKIMVVLPTGGGKTAIASELVRRSYERGKSSIFMCHRQELLDQTYATYGKNGIIPAFIKGGRHPDYDNPMQIASVNTLVRRLDKYKVPDIVFVDECFVGITNVLTKDGYKKIKDIKKGDFVKTFNENGCFFEYKEVEKLIKKKRKERLVCIRIDGKTIFCTENHLFFTKKGWTKAKNLSIIDMVLTTTYKKGETDGRILRTLRNGSGNDEIKEGTQETNRRSFVSKMHKGEKKKDIFGDNGKNESYLRIRKNEDKQSYESCRCEIKGVNNTSGNGLEAKDSWRERKGSDSSSDASCFCSWVGNGSCCEYESLQGRKRIPNELQDRCGEQVSKDSHRGRWEKPLFSSCSGEGQEKREVPSWSRVESCEIYEFGDRKEPELLCEDGFVYDLTVKDNHNYFVEGVLVHNCHHSKASQWNEILDWAGDSVVIGLTATPCRLDGKPLNDMYDKMIQTVSTKDLIKRGYLVPYLYYAPSVIDTSELVSSNGDYTKKSLEAASFNSKIIGDNIEQYKKLANGKRNVVFAISRKHGYGICERYNNAGIRAEFLDGETPDKERKATLDRFRTGETTVLVNCQLFCEGFDLPAIEVVSLLRPTQSTALYLQQVGRALRTCPELGKTKAIILDHVNNYKTHGMPDEEREWSLNTGYKPKRAQESSTVSIKRCPMCFFAHSPALECPNCGYKYTSDGKIIKEVAGELTLVGSQEYNDLLKKEVIIADSLDKLVKIEYERGYKFGFAEKIWLQKTGENLWKSFEGLEKIAKARNYKRSWAWVQWNRIRHI